MGIWGNEHFGTDELWGKWALGANGQFGTLGAWVDWNKYTFGKMGTLDRWALGQVGTNGHQKK